METVTQAWHSVMETLFLPSVRRPKIHTAALSMFPPVDTKNAPAVAAFVEHKFSEMYPDAGLVWLKTILKDIDTLFSGRHPDYAAVDLH